MAPVFLIPKPVENFEISQHGQKILLTWKNPAAYSDGSPLASVEEVEIWLVEERKNAASKILKAEFREKASRAVVIKREQFSKFKKTKRKEEENYEYCYNVDVNSISSCSFHFALRVKDGKGRVSDFSAIHSFDPKIVSLPPEGVRYTLFEDRIEIRWKRPSKNIDDSSHSAVKGYNLYRKEEAGIFHRLNTTLLRENVYSDKNFTFNTVYRYLVRASSTESYPFAESGDSRVIEVEAKDVFPPVQPSGLISIAADTYITLSWDENQEEDLAGYKVWRRKEGESDFMVLTPEPFEGSTYLDSTVEMNSRYYYAITALDREGNESEKSESVAVIVRSLF